MDWAPVVQCETIYIRIDSEKAEELEILRFGIERCAILQDGRVFEFYALRPVRTIYGCFIPVLKFENKPGMVLD